MKKSKIIYLQWEDACSMGGSWNSSEEIEKWKGSKEGLINQVCLVLEENKEFILVASRWDDSEDPYYGFVHKIPTTWIRKKIDLSKVIIGKKR